MRLRLRTLFLITTVVAIVAFTFTLGKAEGLFTLFFFACIFSTKGKRDRWTAGVFLVILLVVFGAFSRQALRAEMQRENYFWTASLDIFFAGHVQLQQAEVYEFLNAKVSMCMSRSDAVPFFRSGYIKIIVDAEELPEVEAEVRRKLAEEFPNLSVTIESHAINEGQ